MNIEAPNDLANARKLMIQRFGFRGQLAGELLLDALVERDAVAPAVFAPLIAQADADEPNGLLFAGNGPAPGAVAAGTVILDLRAAGVAKDPRYVAVLGSGANVQGSIYVEGIRVEIQHNDATPSALRDMLQNVVIRFGGTSLPVVDIPLYQCGGTWLSEVAPAVGAPAGAVSVARKKAVTYWLDNPFVVALATDTFQVMTPTGYTAGGTAAAGIDVHLYGVAFRNVDGSPLNATCPVELPARIQRRRMRLGKRTLRAQTRML